MDRADWHRTSTTTDVYFNDRNDVLKNFGSIENNPYIMTFKYVHRSELLTTIRFRSEHVPLNKFGYVMSKISSTNYETCVTTDVYHMIMESVRFEMLREQISDYLQ